MDTEQLKSNENLSFRANPFASPTEEAIGDDFVGRKAELEKMHNYIISATKISNYHIVGLPRIGKSSLLKAFRDMIIKNHYNHDLVVFYISLDTCDNSEDMWKQIGKSLRKELKKKFKETDKYATFEEELEFEDINDSNVDYNYVCSVARCMKSVGFLGLVLIDEFDNFSTIATKGTVGQLRTLFSGSEFSLRAVIASRRMIERIEKEVEGAINSNVSILAATFVNGLKLYSFNKEDMNDYWEAANKKIGCTVSKEYIQEVQYYAGTHPWLLNILNESLWSEHNTSEFISSKTICFNLSEELILKLYDAFNWAVWRDMEKWKLLRSLILSTWGPDDEIPSNELAELERYGVIDMSQYLTETNGPIRIAISRYFTDWMNLKRYVLPFGDEWSKAESNMRSIVKCFCDDMYQGNERKMINHLRTKHINTFDRDDNNPRYTAEGRFDAMIRKKEKNIHKYPNMSSSIIDYSDPSDLPEIFFKREWAWFEQVFGSSWEEWSKKFATMNEIRNIKLHNNQGVPQVQVELAKKYCHDVNEKIELYLKSRTK